MKTTNILYRTLCLVLMALCSVMGVAQTLWYTHDASGNRTQRSSAAPVSMSASSPASRSSAAPASVAATDLDALTYVGRQTSYSLNQNLPVGNIPYTFQVNPNGSASFSIPLEVPEGQAGLTPDIRINYNSLAGEGVLGQGMNLSCLSSITRCGKRNFYDGVNGAVSTTGDAFELDGLRLIKTSSTVHYMKEVDDFSRITYSTSYFLVQQKDGTKLYYGDYNGSNGCQLGSDGTTRIAWYLAMQQDAHGNYIRYRYDRDAATGDIWLTGITYTLNNSPSFAHTHEVSFNYQEYAQADGGYIGGMPVKRNKILKEITAKTDGNVMRRYAFEYIQSTDPYSNRYPRLQTIRPYGTGGTTALNPLQLEWGDEGEALFGSTVGQTSKSSYVQGDFNGDGRDDLLTVYDLSTAPEHSYPRNYIAMFRYGNPNGFSNELTIHTFTNQYQEVKAYAGDYNGDGLDDVFFHTSSGFEFWKTSTGTNNIPTFTKQSYTLNPSGAANANIIVMADVDGDNMDELVVENRYYNYASTTANTYTLPSFGVFYKYMVGDVDADGCQDIIVCDEYGQVKVASPSKNQVILTHNFGYSYMLGPNCVLLSGYFNNDRYLDFLMIGGYNATTVNNDSKAVVYYHTGNSGEYVMENVSIPNNRFISHSLGDFNGDGLTDLAYIDSQYIDEAREQNSYNLSPLTSRINFKMAPFAVGSAAYYNEGLFLSPTAGGTAGQNGVYRLDSDWNNLYVYPSKHYFLVGDYSGDGKSDIANICEFDHGSFTNYSYLTSCTSLKVICPAHQSTSNLVTGITNGDGTVRSIAYDWQSSAMRNPKFYNGMYAGWNKDIPTFSTVVNTRLESIYGDSPAENISYTYSGTAYISKDVREFQGFKEIVRLDSVSQKSVTESYQIQAPFSAYPYYFCNVRTTKANGQYVSQDTYSLGGFYVYQHRWGTFFISSESRSDNLEGTRETINYTRDSSANITKIRTVHSQLSGMDPLTTIEDMTYANYPGLSTFPNRMTSYRKTDIAAGDTLVHPMKSYSYNSGGDLMSETEHGMTKSYTYDATTGLRLTEKVTAGNQSRTTSYEYDDWRYVKKVTDPMGWITSYTKDGFGNVLTETTPDGRTTTHQYDAFGKLVKTLSHEQVATEYQYQWAEGTAVAGGKAMVKLQEHYDGVKTAETLTDAYGRTLLESSLQPGGVWKHLRSTYGTNGLLTRQEELAGSTVMTRVEYTYDNYRRITQEKQTSANNTALNKTVNYTYSGLTETRTTVTDQEETVTLVYDAKGNLLSQADSKGTTTYSYDAAGHLTGVASPGYPMTATYNEYGLCTGVTNPSSGTTTYTYNGFDELHTETDAKGNTVTYTYNPNGLPTGKNDGSRNIIYTYNTKGQLTYNGYGGGHMSTFTYTADGLLSKEVRSIEGVMLTKQYTYDSKGRLATYTSPSGLVQKYGYDSAHHLTSITDNATGAKLWEAKTYNAQGLIATESGVGGRQTTYTYDQAGRPLTISNNLASFTYTYNGGGQLTKRVENFGSTGLTETFAYDAGGCLTSSTLQGKTPVTVSYNSGRGITNKSDVGTYSYGANGAPLASINRVSSYNPGVQSITYNSSNLPASITQGGYTRTYTYDVNDQRDYSVLTKSNSSLPFAACKRYYFGEFERNINTENSAVTDIDFIFADGRLVALVKTVGTTKTTYGAMTDRQGSLRALYNGSGLVQSFSYDAWGNRRNPGTGNALTTSELVTANSITSRGYTCHEHMDEFGLINMNARIYDPSLGMFISVDPLAQEYYDTYPYAYCGGDPVNRVDWTGEDYWSTNNPDEINKFWTWLSQNGANATGSYTFLADAWFRMGDEEFIQAYSLYGQQALTYNDKTNKLYSSYVTYENNEIVVNGVSTTAVGFSTNKNAFGFEEAYSLGMTSGGIYTGLKELSNVHNGRWKGKNGKWNDLSWGGNRYTGARRIAVNKANLYKGIGKGLFWADTFVNATKVVYNYKDVDTWTRSGLNVAFGVVSTWGGIPGMIIGCFYWGASFEHGAMVPSPNSYMINPVDNTFIKKYK